MKSFCEKCRDKVEAIIIERLTSTNIKGKTAQYTAKIAYCTKCGHEVFIPELRDQNLQAIESSLKSYSPFKSI